MWQARGKMGKGAGFSASNRTKCEPSVNCHFAISSIKNATKNKCEKGI